MGVCYVLADDERQESFELGKGWFDHEPEDFADPLVAFEKWWFAGSTSERAKPEWFDGGVERLAAWLDGRDVKRLRLVGDSGDDAALEYPETGSRYEAARLPFR